MNSTVVERHRTAIRRGDYSRPVKCLLRDNLLGPDLSFFDYGCGKGEDVELLTAAGVTCGAWDPAFRPDAAKAEAAVVNLGYVLNVIENPAERGETLRAAWGYCRHLLAVSAQILVSGRGKNSVEFGDGVLTGRSTFQKFFEQTELKAFIEAELGTEAVPAEPGIFYVFRDEAARQQFVANRFRRRTAAPKKRRSELLYEENRELLDALIAAMAELGRPPEQDEWARVPELVERLGSVSKAVGLVRRITGAEGWEAIAQRRREDLLVFLALARFRSRPALSQLPVALQRDIRAFIGPYTRACKEADELLFRVGDADAIDAACGAAKVGKLLIDDLYVHRDSLPLLDPLLRIYEGCGRAYLGEIEGANVIKIHRRSGKLSYLVYPDFDDDPHPSLQRSVRLNLRTRQLDCYDYAASPNPPVLHRKETFLHTDDERHTKFAKLTAQEEKNGLLENAATIGTRDGWARRLAERGFVVRGHRLMKANPAG